MSARQARHDLFGGARSQATCTDRNGILALAQQHAADPISAAFRAAADGRVAVGLLAHPSAVFPGGLCKESRRRGMPVLLIIGDDPVWGRSIGPDGWKCARRLAGWASFALIHGAGGQASHYEAVVEAAELHRAAVLIECGSATAAAWATFLGTPNRLSILPRGGEHPTATVLH